MGDRRPSSETEPGLVEGTLIDHFAVVRRVGAGGMGDVYLARDTRLGRRVALKLVRPDAMASPAARERFLFEAQATARFNHPHIVAIHFVGEHGGAPYLALEYVEGEDLRHRGRRDPPGPTEALRWLRAVASAVAEAHRQQILHLDLKPDNVVMGKDGRLRVLDFGLARLVAAPPPPLAHGAQGSSAADTWQPLHGTPVYMAPEQWRREAPTAATDVWAFGLLAHELLTGRPLLGDAAPEELPARAAAAQAEVAADLPIVDLVRRCLAVEPGERPTMAEVLDAVERALDGGQARATGEGESSPYRGLLSFGERHAGHFFGRDAEIAAFVERIRDVPILPVVGASGAGKSSFVQAGVIPALRERGAWQVVSVRPGDAPLRTLAARLEDAALAARLRASPELLGLELLERARRGACRILLFVDQLEELVTLVDDERERAAFLQALCTAAQDPAGPVRVVFALRDDFLGRLPMTREVRDALTSVTVLARPGREALAEIIVRPLTAAGYRLEDATLVDDMIDAVAGEPAALPLLQFALTSLWDRRDRERRLLSRAEYQAIGGVAGALAAHADQVLAGLSEEELAVARRLVLGLVTADGTRRAVARDRAVDGPAAEHVLQRLTSSRLITVRQGELELAHEALIRSWDRLARWIEESREERVFLGEIGQAAALWDRRGRRPEETWAGHALADARERLGHLDAPRLVDEFVVAGETRARRQARLRRRWLTGGAVALGVVALGAVAVSIALAEKERRAVAERDNAERERAAAQRESAAAAFTRGDPFEARARLRDALETRDDPESRALWWHLRDEPLVWKADLGVILHQVAVDPNGRFVAVATDAGTVQLLDLRTRERRVLRGGRDELSQTVAFSPDGNFLAVGSTHGQDTLRGNLRIWDLARGEAREIGSGLPQIVNVAYSPDGKRVVATGGPFGLVVILDVASGERVAELKGHQGIVFEAQFLPDGRRMVTGGGNDGTLRLWDVERQVELAQVKAAPGVTSLDVSADGTRVVTGGWVDRLVKVWRLPDLALERTLIGHTDHVGRVRWSPDGTRLASSGYDKTVRIWDPATGAQVGFFGGATNQVWGLAFVPDGRHLVASDFGGQVRVWDLSVVPREARRICRETAVAVHGELLATACEDGTVRLLDARTAEERAVLPAHDGSVTAMRFSSDGAWLATGGLDRKVLVWDVARREVVHIFAGHPNEIREVAFGPGVLATGTRFASEIRVYELGGGRLVRRIDHGQVLSGLDLRGGRLLTTHWDRGARLWRLDQVGPPERVFAHESRIMAGAIAPDGEHVITLSGSGELLSWTIATGEKRLLAKVPAATDLAVAESRLAVSGAGRCVVVDAGEIPGCGGRIAFGDGVLHGSLGGARAAWDVATRAPVWHGSTKSGPASSVPGVLGYADGFIHVGRAILADTPSSPVTALAAGPASTIVAGFGNGVVGVWSRGSLRKLHETQVYGPIDQLVVEGDRARALSALGESVELDLTILVGDYCTILREIWAKTPVVWTETGPFLRDPPAAHACLSR